MHMYLFVGDNEKVIKTAHRSDLVAARSQVKLKVIKKGLNDHSASSHKDLRKTVVCYKRYTTNYNWPYCVLPQSPELVDCDILLGPNLAPCD